MTPKSMGSFSQQQQAVPKPLTLANWNPNTDEMLVDVGPSGGSKGAAVKAKSGEPSNDLPEDSLR